MSAALEWAEAFTPTPPANDNYGFQIGPYITFADFSRGVANGIYGPDDDTRWVYIDAYGQLAELPTHDARGKIKMFPATMICVAHHT